MRSSHLLPRRADPGAKGRSTWTRNCITSCRPRGVEHYRREAKALLRAVRAGDEAAVARAREAIGDRLDDRFVLADALHVVAVEHGHRSWPAFKREAEAQEGGDVRHVYRIGAFGHETYEEWAERLLAAARAGDPDASGGSATAYRACATPTPTPIAERATEADARVCLAREYGFRTWAELAEATDRARDTHYSRLPPELPWKQGRGGDPRGRRRAAARGPRAAPRRRARGPRDDAARGRDAARGGRRPARDRGRYCSRPARPRSTTR